jgi:hypothetical protein
MSVSTYTPIFSITLNESASSLTFSSIPATYRDLIVVMSGTLTSNTDLYCRINGDSGNSYPVVTMVGDGITATSFAGTPSVGYLHNNNISSIFNVSFSIFDYSTTDKHKSVISTAGQGGGRVTLSNFRWINTAAVTSITMFNNGSSYLPGTTFSIYGIAG